MKKYKGARSILELINGGTNTQRGLLDIIREIGAEMDEEKRMTKRYYSMVYKLKRDGLISEGYHGGEKRYTLTKIGKGKLEILESKDEFPGVYYKKEVGSRIIIIMFDVPEKHTKKRVWLRAVLGNLDFKMAQKSVWIGKTKIPKELIADIVRMKMEDFVEIFEVGSTGNLKHLI